MHEIIKGMNPKTVYVAGPLFDEGERWWIEQIEQTIIEIGFNTFLPHRDNPEKTSETVQTIFENNRDAIRTSDLVVANLNGITTDCLLYTSPSPRDRQKSRMPSSA